MSHKAVPCPAPYCNYVCTGTCGLCLGSGKVPEPLRTAYLLMQEEFSSLAQTGEYGMLHDSLQRLRKNILDE
jgi:hypothetical protein